MCPKCGSYNIIEIGNNHSGLIFTSGEEPETYYQCQNCSNKWIENE